MIARIWQGAVRTERADEYHGYLLRTGVAEYRATPGNRGVHLLRRVDGDVAHFVLLTLWEDWAAVRAFAGEDVERAVYYPEDASYLLHMEPLVTHFEALPLDASA